MLEVGLALVLVVLSAAFLGVVSLGAVYIFGPAGRGGGPLLVGCLALAFWVLKYPWNALLQYYRYEAHTLRPTEGEKTAALADGRDKIEG